MDGVHQIQPSFQCAFDAGPAFIMGTFLRICGNPLLVMCTALPQAIISNPKIISTISPSPVLSFSLTMQSGLILLLFFLSIFQ
eukprot:m.215081 g.215081  ORF g.215081 m.215081 type:complete len:83 (+) comp16971_c0_seq12:684-932(+)